MRPRALGCVVALLAAAGVSEAGAPVGPQETPAATSLRAHVALPDGTPVPVVVTLVVDDGAQQVFAETALADDTGVATFAAVPAGVGLHARAYAEYQGARYGSAVTLLDGAAPEIALTVYPVTTEGRPLHVDTLHLIVQVESPGTFRVLQFVTVINTGAAAYAGGPELADGRRAGLVIPVPTAATNVRAAPFPSPAEALATADAEFGSDRVLDARPVPPGGRQVAVTYDLETGGETLTLSLAMPYPVQLANVLVGGPAAELVEVASPVLQPGGSQDIAGEAYALWTAEALQPARPIELTVGPPAVRLQPYHWALVGLGVALLAALAASIHGGGSERMWEERVAQLTERVAKLDLQNDRGEIDAADYFRRRAAEIERLALVDQSMRSQRSGG